MKLLVSSSPHMFTRTTTSVLMRDVIIALTPSLVAAVWIFGWRALLVTAVAVAAAVLTEYLFEKAVGREITIGDFSAVVTGMPRASRARAMCAASPSLRRVSTAMSPKPTLRTVCASASNQSLPSSSSTSCATLSASASVFSAPACSSTE